MNKRESMFSRGKGCVCVWEKKNRLSLRGGNTFMMNMMEKKQHVQRERATLKPSMHTSNNTEHKTPFTQPLLPI